MSSHQICKSTNLRIKKQLLNVWEMLNCEDIIYGKAFTNACSRHLETSQLPSHSLELSNVDAHGYEYLVFSL